MEYTWLLLVLAAQITWAVGIYIDKYLVSPSTDDSDEEAVGTLVLISSSFTLVVAGAIALYIFLTKGIAGGLEALALDTTNLSLALFVGVLEVVWLIPYLYALHHSDETVAPPLFQTIPIFGFVLGFFFFGETPSLTQLFAAGIILLGSLVLNLELMSEEAGGRKVVVHWKSVALMLFASLIVALASFVFKDSALDDGYWGTAFWMAAGSFATGIGIWLTVPKFRREFNTFVRARNRRKIAINVMNETIDNLAILAFYGAVLLGPSTALVQSTVAYQPVLLLVVGMVLARCGSNRHRQKLSGYGLMRRIAGIATIFVGSLLIIF